MRHTPSPFRRTAALVLAVLLLGTSALAVEPGRRQSRQEDLDFLYETLEARHPDLFATTPETVFLARKAEIEATLDTATDTAFLLDLQSLTALARDSHTTAALGQALGEIHCYPVDVSWMDGKWYFSAAETKYADLLGSEVSAVNGRGMADVEAAFGALFGADNPVSLRRDVGQSINIAELLAYLDLVPAGAPMVLALSGGETVTLEVVEMGALQTMEIATLAGRRTGAAPTDRNGRIYSAQALDGDTYYIQYNACREDPELPMETFALQVQAALDGGDFHRIIVDLRSNGGGSDGVIWPLFRVLRAAMDRGTEVVGLIGEATFSSGIINAVELQEMGAALAGESTSGSVSHFGSVDVFTLPHSGLPVQYSTKWIDLNTLLDAGAGRGVVSLTPDVEVPQTLSDFLAGKDTCVDWLLAHKAPLSQAPWPDAPLTRGRFVGALYEAAGAPAQERGQLPFADSLDGIEWYAPALAWGKAAGIAKGTGGGYFSAARTVTWQEAAVFLTRTAETLGLEPETVRTAPLPAALTDNAWDAAALESAWRWGLLPETGDFSHSPSRAQGEAMANALGALA